MIRLYATEYTWRLKTPSTEPDICDLWHAKSSYFRNTDTLHLQWPFPLQTGRRCFPLAVEYLNPIRIDHVTLWWAADNCCAHARKSVCPWSCSKPSTGSGYIEVHGGYFVWDPASEGERILEYEPAYDLFLGNTCFKKHDSHLITYRYDNTATQIEFVLFRELVMDVKVIPGEAVALQHQLLVCNMMIDMAPQIKRIYTPRPKVWQLRDPQRAADSRKSSKYMCPLWKLKRLLLLRKSGQNSI